MEWYGVVAVTVSICALAVSLYNRRRSTLKERVDVTRSLYDRLTKAEVLAKDFKMPTMVFGRNNVTLWRKKDGVWDRIGVIWEVFEELALLDQRGFIDRPLARSYFGGRYLKYDEKWFSVAETLDAVDSLMLARIRSLGSWLPLAEHEAEAAQNDYNVLRRQDRARDAFDSDLREGLLRLFSSSTGVERTEVRFDDEYRIFGPEGDLARLRLRSDHFRGEDIARNRESIGILLGLVERKGVPHWQAHPGALGVIVDQWVVNGETQQAVTYIDLIFPQDETEAEGSTENPQSEVPES